MHPSPHDDRPIGDAPQQRPSSMRMVRGGLLVLSVYALVVGIPALLAPSWFFTEFPLGRGWVAELPPYNEHLVRDAGALFIGFGVLLGLAAAQPRPILVRAALIAWTVSAFPHLLFHLTHAADLEWVDAVPELSLLAIGVLLPLALLWLARERNR